MKNTRPADKHNKFCVRIVLCLQGRCHRSDERCFVRYGATLSEVLVSLLIMAIGVISLASLFPISVLKTARANQLTVATNIRYNAESLIEMYPYILSDPNPVDSNGDLQPFNDYDFQTGFPFVFDPQAIVPTRLIAMPGSAAYTAVPPPCGIGLLPRFGAGFEASASSADQLCAGPDSWPMRYEGTVVSLGPVSTNPYTEADLSDIGSVDFSDFPVSGGLKIPPKNQLRVQFFYNGGKNSATRMVTAITSSNKLMWTEDLNGNNTLDAGEDLNGNYSLDAHALPNSITYETARVEARDRRYTWLLTVRPQDTGGSFSGAFGAKPSFDVTVVVYYGRGFTNEEELIFGTVPPQSVAAIPNLVTGSSAILQGGQRSFVVSWPSDDQKPYLKRGAYIMDAQNGYWYQVENYSDPGFGTSSTITLTSVILKTSSLAMFPRGVVDVFPLGVQTPP